MQCGVSTDKGMMRSAGKPMSLMSSVAVIGLQYTTPLLKERFNPANQRLGAQQHDNSQDNLNMPVVFT